MRSRLAIAVPISSAEFSSAPGMQRESVSKTMKIGCAAPCSSRNVPMVILDVSAAVNGVPIPVEGGYLENVPVVSARVCVECSAEEI
jgi:hypothetical protein